MTVVFLCSDCSLTCSSSSISLSSVTFSVKEPRRAACIIISSIALDFSGFTNPILDTAQTNQVSHRVLKKTDQAKAIITYTAPLLQGVKLQLEEPFFLLLPWLDGLQLLAVPHLKPLHPSVVAA